MRVAVVAGPDPGHSFPAIALCRRFSAAGDTPTLLTGTEWLETARAAGVDAVELAGLDPTAADDDRDAGAKIHQRAARMAVLNVPQLRGAGAGPRGVGRHHRLWWDVRRAAGNSVDRTQPASALPAVEGVAAVGQRAGAGHRRQGPAAGRRDARADRAILAGRDHGSARRSASRSVCRPPIPGRCGG